MLKKIRKSFTAKLMLLIGLVLIMPAVTYLVSVLLASSNIKQFYVRIIDEYGQSEKEGEEFILEQETKKWIKRVSIDAARQVDLFLTANPGLTSDDLKKNEEFRELAIQPVGNNGYTILLDATGGVILVHPSKKFEGKELATLSQLPGLAPIIPRMSKGKFAEGDYLWTDDDGKQVLKYLFATPVRRLTKDAHGLVVVAAASMDEITAPARQRSQGQAVKHILNIVENRRTRDLLIYSLIASGIMGLVLILFSGLLLRKGIIGLKELSDASAAIGGGNFDIKVKKLSDDEFGDVATAFNRMATVLKETVISRNYYERAKIDAEKANRLKSEFLTNISHEIRTPLNGIIGFSEVLLEGEDDGERKGYLENIIQCGQNLLQLINGILDLSKVEAGKIELHISPVGLKPLVDNVMLLFENVSRQKGVRLFYEMAPDVPLKIDTDEMRLRQILINLVDNAVKFTVKGEVSLKIACYKGPRGGTVLFEVKDSGIGIPEEKHDIIFASFTRVAPEGMSSENGTGLGLSISANLVKLLGGEMWLESEPGRGSTFSFTI